MTARTGASWFVYVLGALCVGALVAAVLVVGPASDSQARVTRTATVALGVVQSTVSASGNLEAISQLNLGFKTAGTVTQVYVGQGQHVAEGQLLAALDPQSAEVSLEQARATLLSARATLAKEEESNGESPSPASEPHSGKEGEPRSSSAKSSAPTSTSTVSAATREANLASAKAAVRSAELTVRSDEQAVQNTKLYAPQAGTIVSLAGQVGEVVAASGTTRVTSTSGSSGSSDASGTGAGVGRSAPTGSPSGDDASSSGSGGSGSAFAVLADLSSMQLTVPLSELEIRRVHVGQLATVTVEALASSPEGEGRKLAAHVSEVATLATDNSGVVSYDVTFHLDQMEAGLKPGMSATAEVVVAQAEGLNIPSSAITASTVNVVRDGKDVPRRVTAGLVGNSTTLVLSGLRAGDTVALPSLSTTSPSAGGFTSRLAGRFAGAGLGGAIGGGGGGGGPALFRGGG